MCLFGLGIAGNYAYHFLTAPAPSDKPSKKIRPDASETVWQDIDD